MGSAIARGFTFRSWDRFAVAWPFSRIVVCLGAPLVPGEAPDADLVLAERIRDANRRAFERLPGLAPRLAAGAPPSGK